MLPAITPRRNAAADLSKPLAPCPELPAPCPELPRSAPKASSEMHPCPGLATLEKRELALDERVHASAVATAGERHVSLLAGAGLMLVGFVAGVLASLVMTRGARKASTL